MKPKIGITIGDPNGIGAELILKLTNLKEIKDFAEIYIISPQKILEYYSNKLKIPIPNNLNILEFDVPKDFKVMPGTINSLAGKVAGKSISIAVKLIQKGKLDSILTMPISKIALQKGGYNFSGHTDMLMNLTKSVDCFMFMIYNKRIFCPLTIHIPLKAVPKAINKNFLTTKVQKIYKEASKLFKVKKIKTAILSLNPHSGEDSAIGNEENNVLIPSIKYLKKQGLEVEGPFSSDGFFAFKKYKNFKLIIGMYHDQIMIPFKMLSGAKGVNLTAGLKFIRTSPAHGTAFDIAGKGIADISGTYAALKVNYYFTKKLMNKNV